MELQMNGLVITEAQFNKLPVKEQNKIIYRNTEDLKRMVGNYNARLDTFTVHQKIQYFLIGALASIAGVARFLGFI